MGDTALSLILLLVSFVLVLGGAFVFTNAIEWAGQRMNLGHGAVGSVLAAVATALPESIIPIVAIIGGGSEKIAIGAIIGAPFMLGTLAFALVGLSALIFRRGRENGIQLALNFRSTSRDLIVFACFFAAALVLGLLGLRILNIIAAVVFVLAYAEYVRRTIVSVGGTGEDEEPPGSMYFDPSKRDPPSNTQILLQVIVGLALIVGGAHMFVTQVEHLAKTFGIAALVLALLIAPLASELPEKINSFLWIKRGKDTLALGNITGAMVFQSMIPVAFGLAFTEWSLGAAPVAAMIAALIGGVASFFVLRKLGRFSMPFVGVLGVLYAGTAVYVILGT